MDLELRTISGCPHTTRAGELFAQALNLEGIDPASVAVREIDTDELADEFGFRGSPTFTIDGADLFPVRTAPSVTCRVYQTPNGLSGLPDLGSLRAAVRSVLDGNGRPR